MTPPPDSRPRPPAMPSPESPPRPSLDDEPPPFFGSWNRLYAAVLGWLAVLILLFWVFTIAFS